MTEETEHAKPWNGDVTSDIATAFVGRGLPAEVVKQVTQAAQRVVDAHLDGGDARMLELIPTSEAEAAFAISSALSRYQDLRMDTLAHLGMVADSNANRVRALAILLDLDRCQHGRHEGESCFGCSGQVSVGNEHNPPGHILGYTVHGRTIAVPMDKAGRHDLQNWYAG